MASLGPHLAMPISKHMLQLRAKHSNSGRRARVHLTHKDGLSRLHLKAALLSSPGIPDMLGGAKCCTVRRDLIKQSAFAHFIAHWKLRHLRFHYEANRRYTQLQASSIAAFILQGNLQYVFLLQRSFGAIPFSTRNKKSHSGAQLSSVLAVQKNHPAPVSSRS